MRATPVSFLAGLSQECQLLQVRSKAEQRKDEITLTAANKVGAFCQVLRGVEKELKFQFCRFILYFPVGK